MSYFHRDPVRVPTWVDPWDDTNYLEGIDVYKRKAIYEDIDKIGFNWQLWAIAGSGFFTDSYNLFATNAILPSLAFIYWPDDTSSNHEVTLNSITLAGSMIGQLMFGYLSDRYGRRKLYGANLIFVILGTLGIVTYSPGHNASISILAWIIFWRFIVGFGIGGQYPLSAVIAAESAPRQSRVSIMAAVFLMQPLGQLLGSVVGLVVLPTYGRNSGLNLKMGHIDQIPIVDTIWRIVTGIGAIPALFSIIFQLTIPESPRYKLDIDCDKARTIRDVQRYHIAPTIFTSNSPVDTDENGYHAIKNFDDINPVHGEGNSSTAAISYEKDDHDGVEIVSTKSYEDIVEAGDETNPDPFSYDELKRFFWIEGNGKYLAGTSICWFLLDFAFYGLGINNPRVISAIWSSQSVSKSTNDNIDWMNPSKISFSIYEDLKQDVISWIITISLSSMIGSIIILKLINHISQKAWLAWSFVVLAAVFAFVGISVVVGSIYKAPDSDFHATVITFYVLCQLLFNLGPNTLIFIISAEIFPTRYRGTCYGISAAAGKLGSAIVQEMLLRKSISSSNRFTLGSILIVFSALMVIGAVFTWLFIPELDHESLNKLPNKSLEELAERTNRVAGEVRNATLQKEGHIWSEMSVGSKRTGGSRMKMGSTTIRKDVTQTSHALRPSSGSPSFLSRISYWSLFMSQKKVADGYHRISWVCGCGDAMSVDVKETEPGGALKIQERLRLCAAAAANSKTASSSAKISTSSQATFTNPQSQPKSPTTSSASGSKITDTAGDDNSTTLESGSHIKKYLLLCVNARNRVHLEQIDVSYAKDDQVLFQSIRQTYDKIRKRHAALLPSFITSWMGDVTFSRPQTGRFVKFKLVPQKMAFTAVITAFPCRPPEHEVKVKKSYHYAPVVDDIEDPFLAIQFLHEYFKPGEHLDDFWLNQMPKKLLQKLEYKKEGADGWGIYIVEGPNWSWLIISAIVGVGLATLGIGAYIGTTGDVSGGVGLGAFIVAVQAAIFPVAFFYWQHQ